jgi:hypothetical protein
MKVVYQPGVEDAGYLHLTFGRNPVNSQSNSTTDFREVYWRLYLRNEVGWSGNPYKLSRVTSFANANWAQAMIGHIWGDGTGSDLIMDPASGINANGQLATTGYNDFANLQWLGLVRGQTQIFATANAGHWYCVESHVKLNTPGASDGVFEFWIDGNLEASSSDLNWVGPWTQYGINVLMIENYWNNGAPSQQVRYLDELMLATSRIGCLTNAPAAPTNLQILP